MNNCPFICGIIPIYISNFLTPLIVKFEVIIFFHFHVYPNIVALCFQWRIISKFQSNCQYIERNFWKESRGMWKTATLFVQSPKCFFA
jgi:hypothetical protein